MIDQLLSSLAADIVQAEASNLKLLSRIRAHLEKVDAWARQEGRADVASITEEALALLAGLEGRTAEDPDLDLERIGRTIASLQQAAGADEVPEVDEILADFLATQVEALEEIGALALSFEQDEDDRAELKGRIHTLKGEAGVLSFPDVAAICHAMESAIEAGGGEPLVAFLLSATDWIQRRFGACERGAPAPEPFELDAPKAGAGGEPPGGASADRDQGAEASVPAVPADATVPAGEPGAFAPLPLTGDHELMGEFVVEAREHLEHVDDQLLALERDPGDAEAVNSIFRAFHTIKGLSGFLELDPVQRFAHEAETMLDRVRAGSLAIQGRPLAVTFEVNDVLKRMVAGVQRALAAGTDFVPDPAAAPVMRRIEALLSGAPDPGPAVARTAAPAPTAVGPAATRSVPATLDAAGEAQEATEATGELGRGGSRKVAVREMIKVDASRLDELVDTIGELVIAEAMLTQSEELDIDGTTRLPALLNRMDKITRDLQEMAMSLRMVPIRSTFRRMARLARDVAAKVGKRIEFTTRGEDTELDKTVVDSIGDPLVHMVRNAVDHGLEDDPAERAALGKGPVGHIELRAFHQSGSIHVEIEDDGRGLDPEKILRKAREKGLVGEGEQLSEAEVFGLLFRPGFSTARELTDLSGRGVGLDVVKRNIEALRGSVEIRSKRGRGSVFSIRLPLTLAIIDGIVARVGAERYIFPTVSIVRMVRPEEDRLTHVFGRGTLLKDGDGFVPLSRVDVLFEIDGAVQELERTSAVIVEHGDRRCAFLVDEIVGQQQIVIKPLGPALAGTPGLAGGAIMPDGQVGLILDIASLVQLARSGSAEPAPAGASSAALVQPG